MNELVVIEKKPIIPIKWDYGESVKKTKNNLVQWGKITYNLGIELWIARAILSVSAEERKRTSSGTFVPVDKTWSGYCFAIGSSRQVINRCLNRWFSKAIPATPELPMLMEGKYNIIYADPPWKYYEGGFKNQSQHYPTMSLEKICQLPVGDLAADDCILFMWVTFPMLDNFIDVLRCWGFEYSTVGFTWVKSQKSGSDFAFGLGAWTRSNAEICVIGKRGTIPRQDASVSQIIYKPKGKHSEKPAIVRNKIVQLVGDLPRIELFARTKPDGWDVWGNEV